MPLDEGCLARFSTRRILSAAADLLRLAMEPSTRLTRGCAPQ
jgi:hypothetical protein